MKGFFAVLLVFAFVFSMGTGVMARPSYDTTVTLRVEGISENLVYEKAVPAASGESVGEVLERVLNDAEIPYVKDAVSGYISSINGETAESFPDSSYAGWMYRVDEVDPGVGMFDCDIEGGEIIEVYYGLMDIGYPIIKGERLEDGSVVLTFTYDYTDWYQTPPVTEELPLEDATVTLDGIVYTTDAEGEIVIPLARTAFGYHSLAIAKTDANYQVNNQPLSAVVRLAPDAEIFFTGTVKLMSDILPTYWAYDSIDMVMEYGLFGGTDATIFEPEAVMTRAMFVTVLSRLTEVDISEYEDLDLFTDVPAGKWFSAAVNWAASAEIVDGVGGNLFAPNKGITREEMVKMLVSFLSSEEGLEDGADTQESLLFTDYDSISLWAIPYVEAAWENELISGYPDGSFRPQGTATRAEVATIFARLIQPK